MYNSFFSPSLILFKTNFLISSTYQHWVGGLKESGSGTNYSFKLVAPSEHSTFQVTNVYAHNYKLHFSTLPTTYQRGDTLLISGIKSEIREERCHTPNRRVRKLAYIWTVKTSLLLKLNSPVKIVINSGVDATTLVCNKVASEWYRRLVHQADS